MTEVFVLLAAAALVVADQLTKGIVADTFYIGQSVTVIPHVLNFTYIHNPGAVFGILKDHPWVFNTVTVICVVAAILLLVSGRVKKKLYIWAIGLVISGGIGNMIDRLSLKYVVDFIEVKFIYFPYIFNIADCCVVIGCCLIVLQIVIETVQEYKAKKKDKTADNADIADSADESTSEQMADNDGNSLTADATDATDATKSDKTDNSGDAI